VALIGTWGAVSGFLPVWTDKLAGGLAELTVTARMADPAPESIEIDVEPQAVSDGGAEGPVYVLKKTPGYTKAPEPGEEFTHTWTVVNTGAEAGSGVTLSDYLPVKAIDLQSVSSDQPDDFQFDAEEGKFVWRLGRLPADGAAAEASLTVRMRVAARPRSLIDASTNRAGIKDDAASGDPDVFAVKRSLALADAAAAGDEFRVTLTVANKSAWPVEQVRVAGELPADQVDRQSVSFNREGVDYDASTGQFTWSIPAIQAKNPRAKAINQVVISIGAILGCLAGPLIGGWMGRRPAYFLLCLFSLLVCQYIFRFMSTYDLAFILAAGVAGCATASFYGWLPLYLPELFPTRVRATGQGLSFNFGRIFAAIGAISTGQLMGFFDGSYPRACATITLVYVLGLVRRRGDHLGTARAVLRGPAPRRGLRPKRSRHHPGLPGRHGADLAGSGNQREAAAGVGVGVRQSGTPSYIHVGDTLLWRGRRFFACWTSAAAYAKLRGMENLFLGTRSPLF